MDVKPTLLQRIGNAFNALRNTEATQTRPPAKNAYHYHGTGGNVWSLSYSGEKDMGSLGPAVDYKMDYTQLRVRSWQAFTDNDIAHTIIKKYIKAIIGTGLKLKANPNKLVLQSEKINLPDKQAFNEMAEARFTIWGNSKRSSHSGMLNLKELAQEAYKNKAVGGDVLVILRYVKGSVTVQLIDGCNLVSPMFGTEAWPQVLPNGNTIKHGIEKDSTGQHIAYHVRQSAIDGDMLNFTTVRIEARDKATGILRAFLWYGNRMRLENDRGVPIYVTILEGLKKLERYKEAAVGGAEERQKIAYQIVHGRTSTGEDPRLDKLKIAMGVDTPTDTANFNQVAQTVTATTNKNTINMPIDSEIKPMDTSKQELAFKEFYETNADIICAAAGIPPNVAFAIYNNSFSSSRAAIKDWEQIVMIDRSDASDNFYQPIFNFFLYVEVLKNKIEAPGYLKGLAEDNFMVVEAYQSARFTGPLVPHIDPLKEVNAVREMLGASAANIPLITVEGAVEILNGGDSDEVLQQFAEEVKEAVKQGIEIVTSNQPAPVTNSDTPPDNND